MALKYKYYDEENKKDYCFFESNSPLWGSVCDDNEDDFKTLTVIFRDKDNTNRIYRYYNINVNDYILFKNDTSNGKGINKFIINKGYKSEKLTDYDLTDIKEMYHTLSGEIMEEKSVPNNTVNEENNIENDTVSDENKLAFLDFLNNGNTVTELTTGHKPLELNYLNEEKTTNPFYEPNDKNHIEEIILKNDNDILLIQLKEYLYNMEIAMEKCKLILKKLS